MTLKSAVVEHSFLNGPILVYFRLFDMTQFKYKLIKALMVCLGLKPRAEGWKAQMNALSYGGTHLWHYWHSRCF